MALVDHVYCTSLRSGAMAERSVTSRMVCPKCKQELSRSAFVRHNLAVCPVPESMPVPKQPDVSPPEADDDQLCSVAMDSSEFDTVDSTDTSESDNDSYDEVEVIPNTEDTTPDVDKVSDPEMAGPEEYSGSVQQNTSYLRRIFQAIAIFLSFLNLNFEFPKGVWQCFLFLFVH